MWSLALSNPAPVKIPEAFLADPVLRGYFIDLHQFLQQLWAENNRLNTELTALEARVESVETLTYGG